VLERPLRYLAVLIGAIVVASFGLFAIDETRTASNESQAAIAREGRDPDRAAALELAAERRHSAVRRRIDAANEVVVRPFAGLVEESQSAWVRRGVPSLLALALFGGGFAFLARYSKGSSRPRRRSQGDVARVTGRV
jgi:hypothetical protein